MRQTSDSFGTKPLIRHTASIDIHGVILAAEIIGFFLQPKEKTGDEENFIDLLCNFFNGKDGDAPSKKSINEAVSIKNAYAQAIKYKELAKPLPKISIIIPILNEYNSARQIILSGDPNEDWQLLRNKLENCSCKRLKQVAVEARNLRLLNRGTQLRETLSQSWRDYGKYVNALDIIKLSFVQGYFATACKPENGIVIMNMHKAKGKQFDEVIIFEGWPNIKKGEIVNNANRIVINNKRDQDLEVFRQNFRVSVTRAKSRTTILTPKINPCVLLPNILLK